MPITPVNKVKHSITPSATRKSGTALWNDSYVSWDSNLLYWDSPINNLSNKVKHSITPVNKVKN